MRFLLDLIRSHGPLFLFAAAFLENLGLPIPVIAFLVLAGCLVVEGPVSLHRVFLASVAGALCGDLHWYLIGRLKGRGALHALCRLALNPDICVGRTERLFRTRTSLTVLTAKLIPGLNLVVPPLAGILRLPLWRYLVLDLAACCLWAAMGLGLGVAFGAGILPKLVSFQRGLLALVLVLVGAYVSWRLYYRRYLVRHYSVPKVDPAELFERMNSGDGVVIVDLRSEDDFMRSGVALPGSVRIPPAEFDRHAPHLSREKEIILYCT